MSMNIHIEATREVMVTKTGKMSSQDVQFSCWQTPSSVSYKIQDSANPIQAYKDWILSVAEPVTYPVYAANDLFHDSPPIGEKTYHPGEEHIEELDSFLKKMDEEGYDVTVEVW